MKNLNYMGGSDYLREDLHPNRDLEYFVWNTNLVRFVWSENGKFVDKVEVFEQGDWQQGPDSAIIFREGRPRTKDEAREIVKNLIIN